jgi:putative ABC transport system permease protein
LFRNPSFTVVAVATLALGIASTTVVFSIVDSIILHPLPYGHPDRLVKVWEIQRGGPGESAQRPASFPNVADWQRRSRSFESLAAVQEDVGAHLTGRGEPQRLSAARVSHQLFSVLGTQPMLGRSFLPEEDRPGAEPVVIFSFGAWRRLFGADRNLVGRTVTLNGVQRTVVGIMPESFGFPHPDVDLWMPLAMDPAGNRWARFLGAYGCLRPGVSLEQAQREMQGLAAQLEQENPGPNTGMAVSLVPLQREIIGDTDRPLFILLGAVGFVLLIALVNVTNLFLLRALSRRRELAVCTAFGASRPRILQQFLTESLLLALMGGAIGLLLAKWALRLFVSFSPPNIPRLDEVGLHLPGVALTLAVCLAAALIFGLLPGISAYAPSLTESLRVGTRGSEGRGGRRLRNLLVVGEISLSIVLLVGAGLMTASFLQLLRVDPGFRTQRVLTLRFTLPNSTYPDGQSKASFFARVLERVAAVPGVQSTGLINHLPLSGANTLWSFQTEDHPPSRPGEEPTAGYRIADAGYFRTLGIPLVAGRLFTAADHQKGSNALIINDSLARQLWPDRSPLGRRVRLGNAKSEEPWLTVVGVVVAVRHDGLRVSPGPEFFLPYSPDASDPMTLVVGAGANPLAIAGEVRKAIWELDRNLPLYAVKSLEQVLADSLSRERFNLALLGSFATIAVFLALVGLYALMAQAVVQQKQSIAVHLALGARRIDILRDVLRQGMVLVAVGVGVGMLVSLWLGRLLSSQLFEVVATDPMTLGTVVFLFIAVALAALGVPALRATQVDPMACLKE